MTDDRDHPSITWRYASNVTKRFDEPAKGAAPASELVTRRYQKNAETSSQRRTGTDLVPGTLVADGYRIVAGPLGETTGEAEVYQCRDEQRGVAVALKLYFYNAEPKAQVIEQLQGLVHPNIVRLITHGHWGGRFFEVMEYCAGGVLADVMPVNEGDLIVYLPAILAGLDFCHRRGVIHRDIKPNNLFFRDAGRTQLLLGDFGISSYLDRDEKAVRVTQSASHLTLDYAAPELLDGHEVSIKTDYYSLGMTLLHVICGRSPFEGLSHNDVLVAHLRGRITLPEDISARIARLLKGLTLGNPEARWGFDAVTAWLQGDEVAIDERNVAWSSVAAEGTPYPGYPRAKTPQALAAALNEFNAAKELFRGDIRRWIFDHFDKGMAERIEALEENYTDRSDVGLELLRFILDPSSALVIADSQLSNLTELAQLITTGDESILELVENALFQGLIEAWLEAGDLAGDRTGELLAKIHGLRERLEGNMFKGVSARALGYILDPTHPLKLDENHIARNPSEISHLFQRSGGNLANAIAKRLITKELEEWVRAAEFDGWEDDFTFIRETRQFYFHRQELGAYCLCWHFKPDIPFPFAGVQVTDPRQLAALVEKESKYRREAMNVLNKGWLRAWLVGTGKLPDPIALDHALLTLDATTESKLEAVLQMLDPNLSHPQPDIEPRFLNFGLMELSEVRSRQMTVRNTGRGYMSGDIKLAEYGVGLFLDNYEVEGNLVTVDVTIKGLGLSPGPYRNTLFVQTNGGTLEVPVTFNLTDPVDHRPWWQKLFDKFAT